MLIALMLLIITGQLLMSQTKGIIVDKETRKPIEFVSIYTKDGDKIFGAMSNERGEFNVNFSFQTLFFSHINYEKIEIVKSDLGDTVYLVPTNIVLNEVVVSNKQPQWLDRVLLKTVEQKTKKYQTSEKALSYTYETYTLTDSNGYAFKSKGNIVIPQLKKNPQFQIDAQRNTIKYKDKTAGVDFSNLRRMLYDDFMSNFDIKFIKENNFSHNRSFENKNTNIIQLVFTSKKFPDDEGYIVIDTLNNVVIEAEKNSGTDFNIKTQTSSILRNVAAARGFHYNIWITKSNTKYIKIGQSYYISECKYKFYMKTSTKNKKVDAKYFTSIESKLYLDNKINSESKELKVIPKPYYLIAIMSKQMRLEEEALNKVPVSFEKF